MLYRDSDALIFVSPVVATECGNGNEIVVKSDSDDDDDDDNE